MGRAGLRWVGPLVAVAIVAGAATAFGDLSGDFSSPPAPVPGHGYDTFLQMTGAQTGKFTGGVTLKSFAGAIDVLALDMPSTTTGTTPCAGIQFRKVTDGSTPQIFSAAQRNEQITKAVFSEIRPNPKGDLVTVRITALYGYISSVRHVDSTTTGAYDDVTLAPQNVTIQYLPAHTTTTYACQAP